MFIGFLVNCEFSHKEAWGVAGAYVAAKKPYLLPLRPRLELEQIRKLYEPLPPVVGQAPLSGNYDGLAMILDDLKIALILIVAKV